jgi:hypothetical protein
MTVDAQFLGGANTLLRYCLDPDALSMSVAMWLVIYETSLAVIGLVHG